MQENIKYILYQPMHGLGVELVCLETMLRISNILNRTLVLPIIPKIESIDYERGLEEYFEFRDDFKWISMKAYKLKNGNYIDKLFHILPEYKKEYNNMQIRNTHPVWLKLIEEYAYFDIMNMNVGEIKKCFVKNKLTKKNILDLFDTDCKTIAFTYVNDLIENKEYGIKNISKDPFKYFISTPDLPNKELFFKVKKYVKNKKYVAIHWRRGNNIELVKKELMNNRGLPLWSDILKKIPKNIEYIYVASDIEENDLLFNSSIKVIEGFKCNEDNINAIIDMCFCINADYFIGNRYSTYSNYIYHVRTLMGKKNNYMFR